MVFFIVVWDKEDLTDAFNTDVAFLPLRHDTSLYIAFSSFVFLHEIGSFILPDLLRIRLLGQNELIDSHKLLHDLGFH